MDKSYSYSLSQNSSVEGAGAFFPIVVSSVWNGVALANMDIARKHVTRKSHGDVGMRVCDYPVIQVSWEQYVDRIVHNPIIAHKL